eukprot:5628936-Pyramimonas_sp.AAC.1
MGLAQALDAMDDHFLAARASTAQSGALSKSAAFRSIARLSIQLSVAQNSAEIDLGVRPRSQ